MFSLISIEKRKSLNTAKRTQKKIKKILTKKEKDSTHEKKLRKYFCSSNLPLISLHWRLSIRFNQRSQSMQREVNSTTQKVHVNISLLSHLTSKTTLSLGIGRHVLTNIERLVAELSIIVQDPSSKSHQHDEGQPHQYRDTFDSES